MENLLKLNTPKFPKMISELMHSNQFLKMFSIVSVFICAVMAITLATFATKSPTVLTLTPSGNEMQLVDLPAPEVEVSAAIRRYMGVRYNWSPANVVNRLKSAEAFIQPQSQKAFQSSVSNIVKFSTEKMVSQRAYPESVKVELAKRTALVIGDRITAVQGMKAAGTIHLELTFESGPRTKENPWGIYISKEKEEQ